MDIVISGLGITDLQGLENLGSFGNELSIENNRDLRTLSHLGASFSNDYRTSIRNIGIRNNPTLVDVEGLRYIQTVAGVWLRFNPMLSDILITVLVSFSLHN